MSIIEQTTKLLLTQFKGSSINPAILEYYTADMKKLDAYADGVDTRLSALEAEDILLDGRLDTLEGWKTDTVDPALLDYSTRIGTLESWKTDAVDPALIDHADRISALETWKTDTVTVELASLDGRVDAIEQIIHDLSIEGYYDLVERLDALEEKVNTNSTDITTLQNNVTRLDNRLLEDEQAIGQLNADLSAVGNRVTILEGCCEEVRETLADHNTRINKNASDISALDVRLTRDEANISGNASDITILATQNGTQAEQIQDLYDKYNQIDPSSPTNLYSRVATLETVVGDNPLQTVAQTVTNAVNELHGEDVQIKLDVQQLSSSLIGVQTALDNISASSVAMGSIAGMSASNVQDGLGELKSGETQIQLSVNEISGSMIGVKSNVGDLAQLSTSVKTDLVSAINEVDGKTDAYSTTEVKTNKVWIDGKPIYRTVFVINNPNLTWTVTNLALTNISMIWKKFAVIHVPSASTYLTEFYKTSTDYFQVLIANNGANDIRLLVNSTNDGDILYLVVEYTKTTD